jgi:hypothetical protein
LLQLYFTSATIRSVLRDDSNTLCIVDSVHQRVCRETAEDDGMHRTNTRACKKSDGEFRRHAHVDSDTIALLHAEVLQHIRKALYLGMQLTEGESAHLARLAFP